MKKEEEEVPATAKLVCHGAYQYVRLPKEFRFEGDEVLIGKIRHEVILKPLLANQAKPGKRKRDK